MSQLVDTLDTHDTHDTIFCVKLDINNSILFNFLLTFTVTCIKHAIIEIVVLNMHTKLILTKLKLKLKNIKTIIALIRTDEN